MKAISSKLKIAFSPPGSPNVTRITAVALMVGAIAITHYLTPPDIPLYHDILRRSAYLPIILAAVWFRTQGGVVVALVEALLYAPHMIMQLGLTPDERFDRLVEMLLYVVVGGLTGLLVERQHFQRRQTEEALTQLQQAHEDLRRQTTQLGEVEESLRHTERLSTLGELAADLAHEIRNPLAAIRGTVQILAANPAPEDKARFSRIVIEEVDRLDRVVEAYLRAGRAGAVTGGCADAVAALASVVDLTRRQAVRNRVKIECDGPDHLTIAMDSSRLIQVLMNLVLNAIQAMPDGGNLRIACSAVEGAEGHTAWGDITVSDTGPGVARENCTDVFRPFFTTKPAGTGLGLSIARRLVDEHGGSLTLEPSQGRGSTFRVRLPLGVA